MIAKIARDGSPRRYIQRVDTMLDQIAVQFL